ncbi:MAG: methyltransferase domain-containing protein [Candidatus Heimdallarchaeota archaeon]
MSIDIINQLNLEGMRIRFLKYTRKAFQMLPKMSKPLILDIGCGTGIPTIELAQLSDGEIIGIDIDQDALDKLNLKIEKMSLSNRVKTMNISLYRTNFPNNYFNILWDEGVLHILDLKKSLIECKRLLKPNGYLILGETIKWIKNKFKTFLDFSFKLINQFLLPEKFWWTDYYAPLEKKIKELRLKYGNAIDLKELQKYEREIKMVKKNPREFDCGFYIMQKAN